MSSPNTTLRTYRRLSRWLPFHHLDEKLSGLFFFALMLPLLTLIGCALIVGQLSAGLAVIPVLLASLLSAGLGLWGLNHLLVPVRMAQAALREHGENGRVQPLPTDLRDDMGLFLCDLRRSLETAESRAQAVQALSFEDPLTGLANQRFASEYLRLSVQVAERTGARLSVAVIDPEHIGRINERLGMEAGDQAIRQLGDFLRQWLKRKSDWIGRWHGDQFIAVMFCEHGTAVDYLANLKREFSRHMQDFDGIGLSVHLGVAELRKHEGVKELIEGIETELRQEKCGPLEAVPAAASAKIVSLAAALRNQSR